MLLLITLTLLTISFSILYFVIRKEVVLGCSFIFGFALITCLIVLPISKYTSHLQVIEFNSIKSTIENDVNRHNLSDGDRLSVANKKIEHNSWLELAKYKKNNKWISIYVDEEVLNLEPIK